jgi:hypothetical protein
MIAMIRDVGKAIAMPRDDCDVGKAIAMPRDDCDVGNAITVVGTDVPIRPR